MHPGPNLEMYSKKTGTSALHNRTNPQSYSSYLEMVGHKAVRVHAPGPNRVEMTAKEPALKNWNYTVSNSPKKIPQLPKSRAG